VPAPTQPKIQNPKSKIETPFPTGWVDWSTAAAMLGLTKGCFNRLAIRAGLERRRVGPGRTPYLYDSAAVAELADQRLAASAKAHPNRRIDWWGRRSTKIEMGEFDYWITRNEAAELLRVRPRRISGMCAQGLLPCYQKEPGKRGSQLWVSYSHVVLLRDRPEYRKWRAVWERGRQRKDGGPSWYESEELDIRLFPYRGESPACARDHGDYYTTRQAANVLGVAPSIVREHMRRGRLTGVHMPRHGKGRTGRQWWFVKKEEVHALQADPDYARRRRQYRDSLRARSVLADPPTAE
jgi:hypothetical protein